MATSTDLGAILTAAAQGSYIAQLSGGTYTVTQPIVIYLNSNVQGLGLNGGGATIISQVPAGQPVIEYVLGPGVDCRYLNLSNFTIQGNGAEGDGIKVVADGTSCGAYNWNIDNVTVNHVGGYGIHMLGNVFEGLVSNTWVTDSGLGGALFEHSGGGGVVSALRWFGGGARDNNGAGISLGNGGRDLSVDSATISGNHGPGISAPSGITSVTGSTFIDNQGTGIDFDNYGNFNTNTFSTSGVQSTAISGYLTGDATLIGNTSLYTGSGADPTVLANLTGNEHMLAIGNTGRIVSGSGITSATTGGDMHASVQVSSQGIGVAALNAVTTATVAAVASSTGTGPLETALKAALTGGTVAHLPATTNYTVSAPIVINLTTANVSSTTGTIGIDLGGADIDSTMTNGQPVIEIIVGAGVNIGTLSLSNFQMHGTYAEGDGIKIVVNGTDRSIGTLQLTNVAIEAVGGIGLDVVGNVSHARIFNSWMHGDVQGGARFAGSTAGGVPTDLQWTGGGFRKNGVAGLILDNGAHDMTVKGLYFVDNYGPGINATSGITLVQASGFENNNGAGAVVGGAGGNFTDDTFSTYGVQTAGVAGTLSSGKVTFTGTDAEYYGPGSDPTVVANIQGSGTINMAGGGKLVVGPSVTVAGAGPVLAESGSSTSANVAPILNSIRAPSGDLNTGKVVTLTATFSEAVTVAGGTPTLLLNDGGKATYTGGSGTTSLSFSYTVLAGQNVADLAVSSISLNGASIKDSGGLPADLSAAANYNPSGTLQIDTIAPTVSSIATSGSGITAGTGTLGAGKVVTLTVNMSEAVSVTGAPTLSLNDGGTATYTGGSGTSALTFSYTVASGQNTADLTVSSLNLGSATIVDGAGNAATLSSATNYNPAGTLQISTGTPTGTLPKLTERLLSDTGSSATDKITSNPAVTGNADANAVVHFTVDGTAIAATATANASGVWSFTPTGLADGAHQIVASQTDLAGNTGTAGVKFTLDTTAPAVTEMFVAATATAGSMFSGTGDANAVVHFSVDGVAIAATTTADATGAWSYGTANLGISTGSHTVRASETDTAGNIGTAALGINLNAPLPRVTLALAHDTGASTTDRISVDPTLKGTADPGAVVHFAVDGVALAAAATADASGQWSFLPSGLDDGQHVVEATETSGSGATGAAFLTFTLDAQAPIPSFTGATLANGQATLAGTTGEVGSQVHVYDGANWIGMTTAGSDGTWHFMASAPGSAVHSYGVLAIDAAQHVRSGVNTLILGSTSADTLTGGAGGDIMLGTGGNDRLTGGAGADTLTGGPGQVTFAYNAAAESAPGAADTITDFHAASSKIDFTNIAGITASNGVPAFQSNLIGTGNATASITGNLTLNAHNVGFLEVGNTTVVLVNTSNAAETVTTADMHAADMQITLLGVHLGLTANVFHHS